MLGIDFTESVFAFLATYALHSTVWLSLAWGGLRLFKSLCCEHQLTLLRLAMVGGIFTSVAQVSGALPSLGLHWSLPRAVSTVPFDSADEIRVRTADELGMSGTGTIGQSLTAWQTLAISGVAIWLASIFIHLQFVARDWWQIQRLRRSGREGRAETLTRLHSEVANDIGLRRSVKLLVVDGRQSPIVSGFWHPFILVGEDALVELDEGQIRAFLAHEQAHVLRLDPLWNLLSEVIRGSFGFQPLNHWAARKIRVQSEFAADRSARKIHDPLDLARCLQNFAEQNVQRRCEGVLAIGMASPRSNFGHRVVRLLDADDASAPDRRMAWTIRIAGAFIALVLVTAAPGIGTRNSSIAQEPNAIAADLSNNLKDYLPADAEGFVGVVEGVLLDEVDREVFLFQVQSVEELAGDKNQAAEPSAMVGNQIRMRLMQTERYRRNRRRLDAAEKGDSLRISIGHTDQNRFDLFNVASPKRRHKPQES